MSGYRVGFIGGGNMARALVGGLVSSGFPPANLLVSDPDESRRAILEHDLPGVTITDDNDAVAAGADCLVLAVKPQLMREVCESLAPAVQKSRPLIISVAAGTHSRDIDTWLGADLPIVRVMPNQPALLLQGASGLFANELTTNEQRDRATEIISAVGSVVHVRDEDDIDAVTAISGTGPAYFYFLIDMLIRSAEDFGLDPQAAHKLVMDTAKGSASLAAVSGETMQAMIERVRSPGGTTAAAFEVFDNENVRKIFAKAFAAAKDRAIQLADETDK
ncbi:MAG: pyrroline-5-carboxylate reductase [Woeseiaceae bacterium]|nr:pyrroline-5-carboxylate reductase [Woeseiaceae bacterium]NIP20488.1 pyrroline-5-carboxylate reductase [Woeseiaceae bacterium]NIS89083.1 pyrroline-5-carboxylate reductase [Woeseiaceae bacterium]